MTSLPQSPASFQDILITDELGRRPPRPPDHEVENRALAGLAETLSNDPENLPQRLVDATLELCRAESAVISILEPGGDSGLFRWHAVAGMIAPDVSGTMARDLSPAGTVIDRDSVLLFDRPARHFVGLAETEPAIRESLLVPFHCEGRPVGTLWAIAHAAGRRFDAEDARVLLSLSCFASAGYRVVGSLEAATAARHELERRVEERTSALRESEARLRKELASTQLLQRLSTQLIRDMDGEALQQQLVEAAVTLMGADMGTIQAWDADSRSLDLIAWKGLAPTSAAFWEHVDTESGSCCGESLRTGQRAVVPDVEACDFTMDTPDMEAFRQSGIRAVQSTPLISRSGRMLGLISTHWSDPHQPSEQDFRLLDVLARQAADLLERKQADQRKDEFIAMLSHELRAPLTPIASAVQLLRLGSKEPSTHREASDVIERQLTHLVRLVEDLMEVSRITTGRIRLRREGMALNDTVEKAVEMTRPLIADRGQQLDVSLPPDPVWVSGDSERLAQVVANLLTNANKYTPERGRIAVKLEREDGQAVVRIEDSGVGIPPGTLPTVFDPFVQGKQDLARSGGGLGIGLTLVRSLVEMHGGTVEAHSAGEGRGSEFVVRIPTVNPPEPDGNGPAPPTEESPGSASLRVLVVDDHADTTWMMGQLLEGLGYRVRTASSGHEALEAAREFQPDVVLLDIGLPDLDGYQVAQRMRRDPASCHVVLVAVTGYGMSADRERSREAGFDHHLVKPTDMNALRRILAAAAEAKSSR